MSDPATVSANDKKTARLYASLAVILWILAVATLYYGAPYFFEVFKQMNVQPPGYVMFVFGLATSPLSEIVAVLCALAAIVPFLKCDKKLALGGLILSMLLLLCISAALSLPVWQRQSVLENSGLPIQANPRK